MESNKYHKLGNVTTKKAADSPDIENKLVVTRGERGGRRCNIEGGEEEVQTIRYKISYQGVLCNVGNIANIL